LGRAKVNPAEALHKRKVTNKKRVVPARERPVRFPSTPPSIKGFNMDARVYQTFSTASNGSIRAELSGDYIAGTAGITIISTTPILALCRQLAAAGLGDKPLEAFRGTTLCLHVRSIAEGAGLEVSGNGVGFRPACDVGRRSLARQNGRRGHP
jgi:hypothetical protein